MRGDDRARGTRAGEERSECALGEPALERGRDEHATGANTGGGATADRSTEHALLEGDGWRNRQQCGELAALMLDLPAEVPAASAFPKVAAQVRAAQRAAPLGGELLTDLRAVGLAGGAAGDERFAGLEDERLDLLAGDAERDRRSPRG